MDVKIVSTIGPVTSNEESLKALHNAGLTVARLNGSHGDLDWHEKAVKLIRNVLPNVPILFDIPGRKIRTGVLKEPVHFKIGDPIVFTSDLSSPLSGKVPVNSGDLSQALSKGDVILADDGTLSFLVQKTEPNTIHCVATCDGILKSAKGINIPHVKINREMVTKRDKMFLDFAKRLGIDFIGLSFVDSGEQVQAAREAIGGKFPRIIAKIENKLGLENKDSVIEQADGIMIDRGDLSVETRYSIVALAQKEIIRAAKRKGKPVIVATEMLHTMITNRYPTKAEVSDITNAVLDGASAVMLSGETAIGKYPVESIETMVEVKNKACEFVLHDSSSSGTDHKNKKIPHAIEDAISLICNNLDVTKIVVVTVLGFAARTLSMRNFKQPIIAVSNVEAAARSFNLYNGVEGVYLDIPYQKENLDHIPACLKALWERGKIDDSDLLLVTGVGYPKSGNRMNLIQTHKVQDLKETLGWRKKEGANVKFETVKAGRN